MNFLKVFQKNWKNYLLESFMKFYEYDISTYEMTCSMTVCNEKCPTCERICGVQEENHRQHSCLYGHQMEGMGGTHSIRSKKAVVSR